MSEQELWDRNYEEAMRVVKDGTWEDLPSLQWGDLWEGQENEEWAA